MKSVIHRHSTLVRAPDATVYSPVVLGRDRPDGNWEGWIEFQPVTGQPAVALATDRETTQPNLTALVYWATGLEPIYLEGAFERALAGTLPSSPGSPATVPRAADV